MENDNTFSRKLLRGLLGGVVPSVGTALAIILVMQSKGLQPQEKGLASAVQAAALASPEAREALAKQGVQMEKVISPDGQESYRILGVKPPQTNGQPELGR